MRQVAGFFPPDEYPDMLVGLGEPDDAAAYRIDERRVIIQTTDFFTPIVDDPWLYGTIAAANSMSDVYAMGGEVLVCLNIAGFPEDLPADVIGEIMAGGAAKVREAGGAISGGHTVTNPEPFYGLSVTGIGTAEGLIRKGGAAPGDYLVLTKPLGTGVITTAAKLTGPGEKVAHRAARRAMRKPDLHPADLDAAVASMARLNRTASQAAQAAGVRSGTDVTGFGLLGHAVEMASANHKGEPVLFRIQGDQVPVLPGVQTYIQAGYLTRGSTRNPDHFADSVNVGTGLSSILRTTLWEAETSGGLLLAVPPEGMAAFQSVCEGNDQPFWQIGQVEPGQSGGPVIEVF